jgi:hypothetical protein
MHLPHELIEYALRDLYVYWPPTAPLDDASLPNFRECLLLVRILRRAISAQTQFL